MSTEPIGIVAGLQAKREVVVANLSPAAKHAAFPTVYARPLPIPHPTDRTAVDRLQREKDALTKEICELRRTIANLQAQMTTPSVLMAQRIAEKKNAPDAIIRSFLEEMNDRRSEGAEEWTLFHLTSARRSRPYAMPRHVCMWLVRQLCTQVSLPRIGKLFGGRDHTSALHSFHRAPHWMLVDPRMKAVADAVLLRFGGTPE